MPRPSADPNRTHRPNQLGKNEPHVAVELEHAFNSAGAHAWAIGALQRPIAGGAGRRFVVNGDARQPGRVQLFALLRERNIPFVVHSCDPITEREIAQVPHVGKPAPPSKIVASPADRRTRTLTGT
jgi:hypothetical protein